MYRKHNGRFITKKQHERRRIIRGIAIGTFLLSPYIFVMPLYPNIIEYKAEMQYVEAEEIEIIEINDPGQTQIESAIEDIPHESPDTTDVIKYIYNRAQEAGLDGDAIAHTIYCESMFYNIQSGIVRNGVQEPSFGLAQIHLPSHPNVTVEQAMNPYFAVDFIIAHWDGDIWHGYDRATDTCTNTITEYWLTN